MKQKFIALFLVLLLVLGVTACGQEQEKTPAADEPAAEAPAEETPGEVSEEEPADEPIAEEPAGDPVEISVQAESAWMPHYEKAAERVKDKFPNATINLIEIGAFDHLDVIDSTDATNPDVADVFGLPADRLMNLYQKEVLAALPAKEMADELGGWADYDAGLGGNFNIDGEYMAFPYNIETLITFVNTANAEAQGLDPNAVFEINDFDNPNVILYPVFDAWFGVAAANAGGIELLGKDENGELWSDMTKDYSELNDQQRGVIDALFNYWKKNFEADTALFDADAGWGHIDEQFKSGNEGVARIEGPWSTASISELANGGEDMLIVPIGHISIAGNPFTHWKGGWGLGINSRNEEDPAKMEVAVEMIKQIVNPEYFEDLFAATGKVLENVPAETYANSNMSDIDKAVVAATIESYETAPLRPLFIEWGQVWDTWKNSILSWNAVQPASPEEAYAEMQAAFKAMMENF